MLPEKNVRSKNLEEKLAREKQVTFEMIYYKEERITISCFSIIGGFSKIQVNIQKCFF